MTAESCAAPERHSLCTRRDLLFARAHYPAIHASERDPLGALTGIFTLIAVLGLILRVDWVLSTLYWVAALLSAVAFVMRLRAYRRADPAELDRPVPESVKTVSPFRYKRRG